MHSIRCVSSWEKILGCTGSDVVYLFSCSNNRPLSFQQTTWRFEQTKCLRLSESLCYWSQMFVSDFCSEEVIKITEDLFLRHSPVSQVHLNNTSLDCVISQVKSRSLWTKSLWFQLFNSHFNNTRAPGGLCRSSLGVISPVQMESAFQGKKGRWQALQYDSVLDWSPYYWFKCPYFELCTSGSLFLL